jgi:hypothetical protein
MPANALILALLPVAWLLPNHYPPWVSAWQDGLALLLLGAMAFGITNRSELSATWTAAAALALAVVALQAGTGLLFFGGDALVAAVYLMAFGLSVTVRLAHDSQRPADGHWRLQGLSLGVVFAAAASVGIALVQWTGAISLGMWGVDLPPGGRPFGNVAQPNHLCSIAFLGLCSLALLRERGLIGPAGFALGSCWMLLGMVMTGSRTGWLQIAALVLMALLLARRSGTQVGPRQVAALSAVYVLGVLAWPAINEALLMAPARAGADVASSGTRPLHWAAMLTAIAQEPWFGYGWQQVSVAQVRTAELRPHVGEYIEHSHNLFLDLLIWNGVPVGLLLIGILVWWFATRMARCRDATVFWLMACITGLGAHAMVEYPLAYAYFLIPLGLWIGAVDALQKQGARWVVPARAMQAAGLLFGGMVVWVAVEYLKAEQGHRLLRLESARIGTAGLISPPPDLQLLTQLEAFQRFAHTQARADMSAAELDAMRRVTERYAYPPSMFRYALAQGLNGQPDGAALTLLRLCRIHARVRCEEGRQAWEGLQQQHLVLRDIAFPSESQVYALK